MRPEALQCHQEWLSLARGRARSRLLLLAFLSLTSCKRAEPESEVSSKPSETLVVFAATSLQDAFKKLENDFERSQPRTDVTLSFAGSQELRTQLEHGAHADVFASADQRNMDELLRQGLVREAVTFARNEPVIVVSKDCKTKVAVLADLPNLSRIVLGAPEVPIGRYSIQILERAGVRLGTDFRARVEAKVVSRELNVRQALARVTLGEAEAAIVYRTDANAAGDKVTLVPIEPEFNVTAEYPMAVLAAAEHPRLAEQWLAFVRSAAGQQQLTSFGFMAATAPLP